MSTNINISVGDNKFLAQASLQQNASRQAQLEKEANQRLAREAEINRVNALAAQGKDANGNSLTSTSPQVPQLERRPAANRTGPLFDVGTFWNFYSRTTTTTPIGPSGWEFFINQFGTSYVRDFNNTITNSMTTYYYAAGSGLPIKNLEVNNEVRQQIATTGTSVLSNSFDNYAPTGTGGYYRYQVINLYDTIATRNFTLNVFEDYIVLPTGKDNGILLNIRRSIGDIELYSILTVDYMMYDQSGIFIGYSGGTSSTWRNWINGTIFYTASDGSGQSYPITADQSFSAFNILNGYEESFEAFAINKNTIRPIDFPTSLKNLYTQKWDVQKFVTITPVLLPTRTASRWDYNNILMGPSPTWSSYLYQNTQGFELSLPRESYELAAATPEVYKRINDDLSFTASSNIKEYNAAQYKAVIEDRSAGLFSAYANNTCSDDPSYADDSVNSINPKTLYGSAEFIDFAMWKNKGQTPDYSVFNTSGCPITSSLPSVIKNSKARTTLDPSRPTAPNPLFGDYADLIAIYDAGDPAYCKQMALAMGFTSADLTP